MVLEFDLPFEPRDPVVLAAFEGWNDAAEAASGAIDHLINVFDATYIGGIDPDEYYDFQVNRPTVRFSGDPDAAPSGAAPEREITWPGTRFHLARTSTGRDLLLVQGIEPNMRWRAFVAELLAVADEMSATVWMLLGALLADVPHTRPIQVTGNSSDPEYEKMLGLEASRYEGPTGINGVLTDGAYRLGIPSVSFWAAVPHYVAQPPCPKATLALLRQIEDALDLAIDMGDLPESAKAWERGVAELADNDDEIAEYVRQLEQARDTTDLPEASGDAIAAEFESYLRRRNRDDRHRRSDPGDQPG